MDWPAHRTEMRDWRPPRRLRNIRRRTRIAVSIPPFIGEVTYQAARAVAQAHQGAVTAVGRLETAFGQHRAPVAEFLLRTQAESSDSDPGWQAFGNALGGEGDEDSRSQLAGVRALVELVQSATQGPITAAALSKTHRLLMGPGRRAEGSGAFRTAQSWVGEPDSTPIDAVYVPPPPDLVPALVDDLLAFANRSDPPALAQAAIAYVQLLCIQPFGNGNHRVGRALVNAILRRRGLTRRIAVPLARALRTETDHYFALLSGYRSGDAEPFVAHVLQAALSASEAAEQSAIELTTLPQHWRDIARPSANSPEELLINHLLQTPVFNAATAQQITGVAHGAIDVTLHRLTEAGVLEVVSAPGAANSVWGARDVLTKLGTLPLITGVEPTPRPPSPLDSVMVLSALRFRL